MKLDISSAFLRINISKNSKYLQNHSLFLYPFFFSFKNNFQYWKICFTEFLKIQKRMRRKNSLRSIEIFARLFLSFLKKKKRKEKREEKIGSLHTLTILFQWTDIQTRFFSPLSSDQVIILQSGTFDKTVPHNYQANPSLTSLHNRSIMSITLTRSNYKRL